MYSVLCRVHEYDCISMSSNEFVDLNFDFLKTQVEIRIDALSKLSLNHHTLKILLCNCLKQVRLNSEVADQMGKYR